MSRSENTTIPPSRIAVLAGGSSAERTISLESGENVVRALVSRGHDVTVIDPAEMPVLEVDWNRFDVAFLALHGAFGEDGQIQSLLQDAGIPFTGSDALASRTAFSKSAAKLRFAHAGVPTPPSVIIRQSDDAGQIFRAARRVGYPLVVKPDAQGSSLGISFCDSPDDLPEAQSHAFHFGRVALLESMIAGTEWTVAVLDDLVLPVIEIATTREFFDYEAKYQDDATEYRFEFDEPTDVVRAVQNAAYRAARAVGTSGIARVDLRVDRWGQPWVLEVNTIPGFTSHSLVPKAAARAGIAFPDLCERAIASALRRLPVDGNSRDALTRRVDHSMRRVG